MAASGATAPVPTQITLHQASRVLEVAFADGRVYQLPCELLRVYSPSAEVRGHGPGQEVLQAGKRDVQITAIEPVGTYAVKLVFSDGHDTGLYSWDTLYELGRDQEQLWQRYLRRLNEAGASRDAVTPVPRTPVPQSVNPVPQSVNPVRQSVNPVRQSGAPPAGWKKL
jgi:DUF971 family protein